MRRRWEGAGGNLVQAGRSNSKRGKPPPDGTQLVEAGVEEGEGADFLELPPASE